LRAALDAGGPVLFVEHKLLYPQHLVAPGQAPAPLVVARAGAPPFEVAVVRNFAQGEPDVVLFTYAGGSRQLDALLTKLAEEEIRVTAVLPSLLNRLDGPLLASYARTAQAGCIVWEEGTQGFDWGAEVVATLHAELGPKLKRVRRLATAPTVIPAAKHLEQHAIPGIDAVERAVLELAREALGGAR
jgi:pyruvate/2-oxoglutarate/acetoin dehydrogenase E1 component